MPVHASVSALFVCYFFAVLRREVHDASTAARGMRAVNSCWGGLKKANSGCRALVVGLWFPELGGVLREKFFTFPEVQGQKLLLVSCVFWSGSSWAESRA